MNSSETIPTTLSDDLKAELQGLLANPRGGIINREAAKRACQRMDRIREENRLRFGDSDIGVEIVREMRDSR